MAHSVRSCLTVGIATITAATIAFAPSVKPPAPIMPTARVATTAVQLTAQVQPLAAIDLPVLLVDWVQRITVPPSAGQPFPTPQFPPVVEATSIGSSIISIYNAVEPWARYVADLAAYAVGWIPYVGWLAPQITIFYNFGERIARSITYNIANWLDGNISFGQGLVNVGVDTVNSFIFLANDQLAFWLPSLPPIPPLPPIFFPFSAADATTEVTTAAVTEDVTTESAVLADPPTLNEKPSAVTGEVLGEEPADEVTVKGQKKSDVEALKEARATTSASTGVAAQGEMRGAQSDETTEAKDVPNGNGHKKGDRGPTADGATGSSASAATHDDTGTKHDKKDATGKKE
jgi:hypothetical protein